MKPNPFCLLAFLHWNHAWNNFSFPLEIVEKAAKQIRDLGIDFIRTDVLWSDVYTQGKKNDYARYDEIVSILKRYDIRILALLHYNKTRDESGDKAWNNPPDSFDEFADYVHDTVKHFKGRIDHWEIWNEPNHPIYWSGPKDNLKLYTELLKKSYTAAKAANSTSFVINGGFAQPFVPEVRNLYENGGKNFTDAISIHPFIDPFSPKAKKEFDELISSVENVMREYSDSGKKIWITEMGCPGMPPEKESIPWFSGAGVSEKQQAEWITRQYGFLETHPSIEKMFWAFYRDIDNMFPDGAGYMGLVRDDLSPKPAYFAYQKLIRDHGF